MSITALFMRKNCQRPKHLLVLLFWLLYPSLLLFLRINMDILYMCVCLWVNVLA